MTGVDTSAEAVERTCAGLCEYDAHLRLREKPDPNGNIPPIEASWLHIAEQQLRALAAERDELQDVFNRSWDADMRAIKAWQQTNPGNNLVWPDRAALTAWLLAERDALRAAQADYLAENDALRFQVNNVPLQLGAARRAAVEEARKAAGVELQHHFRLHKGSQQIASAALAVDRAIRALAGQGGGEAGMPDPDTVSRRTRAAVDAGAAAMCYGLRGDNCDCCLTVAECRKQPTWRGDARLCIAAYLRAQGRDIEARQVERCRDE